MLCVLCGDTSRNIWDLPELYATCRDVRGIFYGGNKMHDEPREYEVTVETVTVKVYRVEAENADMAREQVRRGYILRTVMVDEIVDVKDVVRVR